MSGESALRGRLGLIVAVALAALTLRPQLVGLGPVLPRAQDALGISHSVASLLAAIPVIGMGVFAPAAAPLAARVGAIRAVTVALALIAGGGVARAVLPGAFAVIALTVPIGSRHGARQRAHGRRRQGALRRSARCSSRASTRAASRSARRSPTALSVPIADAGDSWRAPMLVFSLAAAGSLVWWLAATHGGGPRPVGKRAHFPLRKPVAWLFVALFATTAFVYYGYAAWLPDAFTRARLVGWPRRPARRRDQRLRDRLVGLGDARRRPLPLVAARAADPALRVLAAGALGIALDPSHALFWACVLGIGNGAIFPLMMTLPLDAADRPEQVAGVVGMMLGIGYCIGALAPTRARRPARLDRLVRRGLMAPGRDRDRGPRRLRVLLTRAPGPRRPR